jgi:hypothetical protein
MTTPDDSILNGISIGHPSGVLDLDAEGNSIWRRPLVKYAITRHEISGCVVEAKNRSDALDIAAQLPDSRFEREEECDWLHAEMIE